MPRTMPTGAKASNEARYLFDPESIRSASEPSPDGIRLIWMFLRLLRKREIDVSAFVAEFGLSEKTFRRDVAKLRLIGARNDFVLTPQRKGRVALASVRDVPDPRQRVREVTADTLRAVADALGELVASDIVALADTANAPSDSFLRIAMPQLVDHTSVAAAYRALRDAWRAKARVRFRYPRDARADTVLAERVVEPHHVTYYDGRYYLVAYDARPNTAAWRQFALDRIVGPIVRSGTFARRLVPRQYRGEDALGLFKTAAPIEVTIAISSEIAAAVFARRWQRTQRTASFAAGWDTITFDVFDLGEAVRWALGFGEHARVVAPPEAVALAHRIARSIADAYAAGERVEA